MSIIGVALFFVFFPLTEKAKEGGGFAKKSFNSELVIKLLKSCGQVILKCRCSALILVTVIFKVEKNIFYQNIVG